MDYAKRCQFNSRALDLMVLAGCSCLLALLHHPVSAVLSTPSPFATRLHAVMVVTSGSPKFQELNQLSHTDHDAQL